MSPLITLYFIAGLTALTCALAGVFLVLRRMAMVADAISHSVLPGLVAGFWFASGPNLLAGFIGAVAAGLVTVWAVEALSKSRNVREDAAIGLVFPAMFAAGVLWISLQFANVHLDTDAVLFGEITLAPFTRLHIGHTDLGPQSLWLLGLSLILNAGFLYLFKKELKFSTFDPVLSRLQGFRPAVIHYSLMTIVAITTVAAFTAVGAILAVALIIVPTVIASLFSQRLNHVIALSIGFSLLCAVVGTSLAVQVDLSISGLIATLLGVVFVGGLLLAPRQGIFARRIQLKQQKREYAIRALISHLFTHAGEEDEALESSMEHLHTELGWEHAWATQIAEMAERQSLIKRHGNRLVLTKVGIATATAIAGESSFSNPETAPAQA